ncbi:methyltransferase type 11 [Humibacillus sp. DSM 29435]|uniref:class I SAM-dependent methyltransferase n=1 Tax=Humibacillus sp. DSM 29435 TaxID=1869167 RepID=UPI0008723324|nr:class I SAM-dependent methyltransferase [Humibacillus sp. DSM 29435]OFE16609.1 methyltransferase type 11 [Humibacillus sp. DSM 29435]
MNQQYHPSAGPAYTHGHHESVLRSHRWRTANNSAAYLLPMLHPGLSVLDVGCGPGTITVDLAEIVSPGRVLALEPTEAGLDLARAEAERRGVSNVDFAVGDVLALGQADDSFDVVHAHQVLQHVPDPVGALREMARVCRPEGVVAARDADYASFAWYPLLPRLDDWLQLYERVARANGGEPDAGRRLLAWARDAGLGDIRPSASIWCYASEPDRRWWGQSWAARVLESDLASTALAKGLAEPDELQAISRAWVEWSRSDDGWFTVPHGEILASPAS